jgi:hypothetical protein
LAIGWVVEGKLHSPTHDYFQRASSLPDFILLGQSGTKRHWKLRYRLLIWLRPKIANRIPAGVVCGRK